LVSTLGGRETKISVASGGCLLSASIDYLPSLGQSLAVLSTEQTAGKESAILALNASLPSDR